MRRPSTLWIVACVIATASAIACVDLFHSTSDVQSLCDIDANAPGCDSGSDAAVAQTLCAGDAGAAQNQAKHACSWLAACEHPIGRNLTGTCMVDAILAYDCVANPNRKPAGKSKAFWECMQNANTCADVSKCVYPDGAPQCVAGGFLGCSQSTFNVDTRVDCPTATTTAAPGENCAAHGQTCSSLDPDASNDMALCVGPGQLRTCTGSGCVGTFLSLCDDAGIDRGYDCTSVGAASCDLAGPSCIPSDAGAGAPHTTAVTCTSGNIVAQGSPAALKETVDCTAISGPGTCVAIDAGPPGTVPSDACQATGCTTDVCNASHVNACVRGRVVDVDCTGLGLQPCNDKVATQEGDLPACTPP